MAKYAFIQFKINNDFFDWETAFYSSQPTARKHVIVEIFHGMKSEDPSSCAVQKAKARVDELVSIIH